MNLFNKVKQCKCFVPVILVLLFFAMSCKTKQDLEQLFPISESLYGENVGPINFFLRPDLCLIDSSFILVYDPNTDQLLHFFDINFNHIASIIDKGRGPNEILSAKFSQQEFIKNRELVYFDNSQDIVGTIGYSDLSDFNIDVFEKFKVPVGIVETQNLLFIGNGNYVARGCLDKGKLCFFNSNEVLRFTPFYPKIKGASDIERFYEKYNGELSFNKERERIVCSNRYFNQLEIYSTEGKLIKEIRLEKLYNSFTNADTYYFYNAIYSTDKYIYASYIGLKSSDLDPQKMKDFKPDIHVFNWEGDPIAILHLDRLTGYFAVDEKDQFLICIDEYNDDQPFVRYKIPDTLR